MASLPLTSRPLDLVYFIFFFTHVPITLLLDLQVLQVYSNILPEYIRRLPALYVGLSSDPLIGGATDLHGTAHHFVWFRTFLTVEAFFQLPVFFLGMYGLWKGSRSIYVLLLAYGASTATTTLPCLTVVLATPLTSAQTVAAKIPSITPSQRWLLLSSYLPYLLLPLIMSVDMGLRVQRLVQAGVQAEVREKKR